MNKKRLHVAIVGCGQIAGLHDSPQNCQSLTHACAFYRHGEYVLQAVVEPNVSRRKLFQKKWQVPYGYSSLKELSRDGNRYDVVSVCSPDNSHCQNMLDIVRMDIPPKVIFAEKPVCLTQKEFIHIEKALQGMSCQVIVNHTRRFDEGHRSVRDHVKKKMGAFLEGYFDYTGGWMHNGVHMVDTLCMLFGKRITVEHVFSETVPGRGTDECFNVLMRIQGAPMMLTGFDERRYQIFDAELRFENGRILLRDFGTEIIVEQRISNKQGERLLERISLSCGSRKISSLAHAVSYIASICREVPPKDKYGVSLKDSKQTMQLLWEVQRMHATVYGKNKGMVL